VPQEHQTAEFRANNNVTVMNVGDTGDGGHLYDPVE
jgi:hypothetical protein